MFKFKKQPFSFIQCSSGTATFYVCSPDPNLQIEGFVQQLLFFVDSTQLSYVICLYTTMSQESPPLLLTSPPVTPSVTPVSWLVYGLVHYLFLGCYFLLLSAILLFVFTQSIKSQQFPKLF